MRCRAVELLKRYYSGQLGHLDDSDEEEPAAAGGSGRRKSKDANGSADGESLLLSEQLKPRGKLAPLLVNLADRWAARTGSSRESALETVLDACVVMSGIPPLRDCLWFSCASYAALLPSSQFLACNQCTEYLETRPLLKH